jgi:hypothetical protein
VLFTPYVVQRTDGQSIAVEIVPASQADLAMTHGEPAWQTDWGSTYLSDPAVKKYSMKAPGGELIALGAYQITGRKAYVYILYAESAPHSNPTIVKGNRKYYGIGAALIAFGIKFSIDNGCRGDVVFEAKTDELAKHYAEDFHAKRIPSVSSGGPKRFMLADEDAWALFSQYLSEEE